jgi:hypothetical protein
MNDFVTYVLNGATDLITLLKTGVVVFRVVTGADGLFILSAAWGAFVVIAIAKTMDGWKTRRSTAVCVAQQIKGAPHQCHRSG